MRAVDLLIAIGWQGPEAAEQVCRSFGVCSGDDVFVLRGDVPEIVAHVDVSFSASPTGGTATLLADGHAYAQLEIPIHLPAVWTPSGGFLHVGRGSGFPVDDTYRNPWAYTGDLADVTIDTTGRQEPPSDLALRIMRVTD